MNLAIAFNRGCLCKLPVNRPTLHWASWNDLQRARRSKTDPTEDLKIGQELAKHVWVVVASIVGLTGYEFPTKRL